MSLQRSWPEFRDSEKKVNLNLESKKPQTSICLGFLFLKHLKLLPVIDNTSLFRFFPLLSRIKIHKFRLRESYQLGF